MEMVKSGSIIKLAQKKDHKPESVSVSQIKFPSMRPFKTRSRYLVTILFYLLGHQTVLLASAQEDVNEIMSGETGEVTITDVSGKAADSSALEEMELVSNLQIADKSFAFFDLKVTSNEHTVPTGEDAIRSHLAINAYAKSFGSDPDIFVSKSKHVKTLAEADWHSTRDGSDTCIVHSSEFEVGDVLYITIACMNECSYDLRAYYAQEFELSDSERMVFRWGGHVTNILKYRVPETTSIGETQKFEVLVEPEVDYKFIEVFLSHD